MPLWEACREPVVPVPNGGDRYFNDRLGYEMVFDGSRQKWFSHSVFSVEFFASTDTKTGDKYTRHNGQVTDFLVGAGTITKIAVVADEKTNAHAFNVCVDTGTGKYTCDLSVESQSNAPRAFLRDTEDFDFSRGLMSVVKTKADAKGWSSCTITYRLRADEL